MQSFSIIAASSPGRCGDDGRSGLEPNEALRLPVQSFQHFVESHGGGPKAAGQRCGQ